MIRIDMPIPRSCLDCPCSYWVQTGPMAGQMICNVMDYLGHGAVVVDTFDVGRDTKCPIEEEK